MVDEEDRVLQKIMTAAFTILAFVLGLLILPIALPVMLIFRIYRTVVFYIIKKQQGEDILMVSGDDSVWLQDSPENRAVINALMMFKGDLDIDKIRAAMFERLIDAKHPKKPSSKLFPKITKYATKILHRYVWCEDSHFDIKNHVYLHPEPAPQKKSQLEAMVGELCSAPLPIHKPAWQFILFEGKGDNQHHCGVFRAHHSLADGISLVRLMLHKLVDEKPKKSVPARFGSRKMVKMFARAVIEGPALLLSRLLHSEDCNVLHGPKLSGTKLTSWSEPIDLNLIKDIKNATNTTVNDVVMSCIASTFRDYFKKHSTEIPANILSYIPVDVRPSSSELTLDNQFALVFLDLPLSEEDNLKTLKLTKKRMDLIKNSPEPIVNAYTIKYCMNRFPNWLTQWFFDWAASKSSLILSNIPGPEEKLSIGGHQLESLIFWPPQKTNVGLGVSIFSYCGTVRLGIYVDKNILSNPRVLVDGFVDNVQQLAKMVKEK